MGRRNLHVLAALLWFAAFAVAALAVFHLKLQGLQFHTRDFPFYAGSMARIFSADLSKTLAVNPAGFNLLGFSGTDGYPSVYFDVHISPVKFALSGIYAISGSLYAVFGAYLAMFLLAIGYLVFAYWTPVRREQVMVLIGAGALALIPSAYDFLSFDFRTFTLIPPFLFMLAAALDRRRPSWEVVLIALLGLSVREEAVIFIFLAAIYLRLDARVRVARILFLLAAVCGALAYTYYALFTEFQHAFRTSPATQVGLLALGLAYPVLELASVSALFAWASRLFHRLRPFVLVIFALPFAAEFAVLNGANVKAMNVLALTTSLTTGARWYPGMAMAAILVLSVVLAVWPRAPRAGRLGLGVAVAVALLLMTVLNVRGVATLVERGTPRQIVWPVAEHLRTLPGTVVVDYVMHQAFFDRDDIIVWERLPTAVAAGKQRFFPRSREVLTGSLAERAAYYVVTPASFGPLLGLLGDAGVAEQIEPCLITADIIVARRVSLSGPCSDLGLVAGPAESPAVLSEMRWANGRYDAAIEGLRQSAAGGGDAASLTALARMLVLSGRPAEATRPIMLAAELLGLPTPEQLYLVALASFAQERYGPSAALAEMAMQQDPQYVAAGALLVAAYSNLGRLDDAARALGGLNVMLRNAGRLSYSLEEAQIYPRYRQPEDLARYLGSLRRAGVPETP